MSIKTSRKPNDNITILFVGYGDYEIYDIAFYRAAKKIDNVVPTHLALKDIISGYKIDLFRRFEYKYSTGYGIRKLNKRIVEYCKANKTDIVFLYSCRFVYTSTIKSLKEQGCYIASYCNDNPFSDYYPSYFWRKYRDGVKWCDINYVYRESDLKNVEQIGSLKSKLLRSYYIKERNYYIPDDIIAIDVPEVVFVGHYEDDERTDYILSLAEYGIRVGVPRNLWENHIKESEKVFFLDESMTNYNLILNKAKIALVFLSKINKDTYTRRCFEIPATKTMMCAPYTEDMANLFLEDNEIVFFRNKLDFINKVKYYLNHDLKRERIGKNGYSRLLSDGHDVTNRVKEIISDYINTNRKGDSIQ